MVALWPAVGRQERLWGPGTGFCRRVRNETQSWETNAVGESKWEELLLRVLYFWALHGLLNFCNFISHFRISMCCSPLNENKFPSRNFSVLIKPQNCWVNQLNFIRQYLS